MKNEELEERGCSHPNCNCTKCDCGDCSNGNCPCEKCDCTDCE